MTIALLYLATALLAGARPPEAEQAFAAGLSEFLQGRCETALGEFSKAIALDGEFLEAHRTAAECLLKLDRPREALSHLEEAQRVRPADKATKELLAEAQEALKRQPADRVTIQASVVPPRPKEMSLGEIARVKGAPKVVTGKTYVLTGTSEGAGGLAPAPSDAPSSLLDSMRDRAESVFRPRMQAVAKDVKAYKAAQRQYADACAGRTQTRVTQGVTDGDGVEAGTAYTPRGTALFEYRSQATWTEHWRAESTIRNETTPACLAIASDLRTLASSIGGAMDGADNELRQPPSVYAGIADQVFSRLSSELW